MRQRHRTKWHVFLWHNCRSAAPGAPHHAHGPPQSIRVSPGVWMASIQLRRGRNGKQDDCPQEVNTHRGRRGGGGGATPSSAAAPSPMISINKTWNWTSGGLRTPRPALAPSVVKPRPRGSKGVYERASLASAQSPRSTIPATAEGTSGHCSLCRRDQGPPDPHAAHPACGRGPLGGRDREFSQSQWTFAWGKLKQEGPLSPSNDSLSRVPWTRLYRRWQQCWSRGQRTASSEFA